MISIIYFSLLIHSYDNMPLKPQPEILSNKGYQ